MSVELIAFDPGHATLVASWATSAAELDRWAARRDHPLDPAVFATWHADPDVHAWMLLDDDEPVAYGEVWNDPEEGEAELARLIVDPARRGRGIGRLLVGALATRVADAGFDEVWVRVVPDNAPAIACYSGAGFVRAAPEQEAAFNSTQPRAYVWMRLAGD